MNDQEDLVEQFVVCVSNDSHKASLELHKIYQVLPDKEAAADGDLRVVDESGEDYLFPSSIFKARIKQLRGNSKEA